MYIYIVSAVYSSFPHRPECYDGGKMRAVCVRKIRSSVYWEASKKGRDFLRTVRHSRSRRES